MARRKNIGNSNFILAIIFTSLYCFSINRKLRRGHVHHVWQPHHNSGEDHQNDNGQKICANHWQGLERNDLQRLVADARSNEHVFAKRRRGKTDAATADQDQAEVDRVNAESGHDWQKHRCYQHDYGQRLHEHPEENEQTDNHGPDHVNIVCQAKYHICKLNGNAIGRQQIAEGCGSKNQHKHTAGQPGSCVQGRHESFEFQFAVYENTYEKRIENSHDGRFCRREKSCVYSAQNNQRGQNGPKAILYSVQKMPERPFFAAKTKPAALEEMQYAKRKCY